MALRECYHCKQMVEDDGSHDCWTTTEGALTRDLPDDLRDAWERLRETAADLGEQRIYASHNSIMFARKSCYFFVRPRKTFLEVCVFLGRAVKSPRIRRVDTTSKTKFFHIIQVRHRDEVEAPLTDWLREAYDGSPPPMSATANPPVAKATSPKAAAPNARPSRAKAGAAKGTSAKTSLRNRRRTKQAEKDRPT